PSSSSWPSLDRSSTAALSLSLHDALPIFIINSEVYLPLDRPILISYSFFLFFLFLNHDGAYLDIGVLKISNTDFFADNIRPNIVDRKRPRLKSRHVKRAYALFCLRAATTV